MRSRRGKGGGGEEEAAAEEEKKLLVVLNRTLALGDGDRTTVQGVCVTLPRFSPALLLLRKRTAARLSRFMPYRLKSMKSCSR